MKVFDKSPCANPVFYRTYSRLKDGKKESWEQTCDRTLKAIFELGRFTKEEEALVSEMQRSCLAFPSGRWLWCGGSDWLKKPENYPGAFNCSSTNISDLKAFGDVMELAAMGCGTGANLESKYINQLPEIKRKINPIVTPLEGVGKNHSPGMYENTVIDINTTELNFSSVFCGDSRQGWVDAYQFILNLAFCHLDPEESTIDSTDVYIDLSYVRPQGKPLKGFGGTANPAKLPELFGKVAKILNGAVGRKLTSVECSLIIDEAALVIVAGNVRRSAGIRQFSSDDTLAKTCKENLWQQDEKGNWKIDPNKDALRMANHSRVFHKKPTYDECLESVRLQYQSGEGAIQWAGEAVARANADIIPSYQKQQFIYAYNSGIDLATSELEARYFNRYNQKISKFELSNRINRYGINPCGEVFLTDNFCNLAEVPLNLINPWDIETQEKAFRSAALSCCALLQREFSQERYNRVRQIDPIVAVSFTGYFDFLVNAFGRKWLEWCLEGRPKGWGDLSEIDTPNKDILSNTIAIKFQSDYYLNCEQLWLYRWQKIVRDTVVEYCDRHNLKVPNRYTTVQPSGTKSLLTNASPGWHPPKAANYIRRITFERNDPIALACIDYGYTVIPSPSQRDEEGNLHNDPFHSDVAEWLVEIPVQVPWYKEAEGLNLSDIPIAAQFDLYMTVQKYYATHNTSATLEIREHEIEILAMLIHNSIQKDEGYSSAAILAKFDAKETFPRLPFEPITSSKYQELLEQANSRRKKDSFQELLDEQLIIKETQGPAQCDSDRCLISSDK